MNKQVLTPDGSESSPMRTIGAVKNVTQIGSELHISLHKIANITSFLRIYFNAGFGDLPLVLSIKPEVTYSGAMNKTRRTLWLVLKLPTEEKISLIEFFEENNPDKRVRHNIH